MLSFTCLFCDLAVTIDTHLFTRNLSFVKTIIEIFHCFVRFETDFQRIHIIYLVIKVCEKKIINK